MSQALYRRYRPETFQEVIGQEHVTEPLMAALRADRANHAYLFSGPRGCGKTTSARILARCLNCEQGPTDTPCGTCPSCVELARGGPGSLDVVEIDAASHNGVDDARELRERASFAPARDRYKIFILDEAHMVSSQGFNALLKLVEEPPAHIKFIFATTEPDKVIGTIRSRTHHYPFRLVPPEQLLAYLEQLCASEGVRVGGGVLPMVVRAGGGSVRDTLSVLDQLLAGAQETGLDYERAVALLGYTDSALLDDVVDSLAARDGASLFRVVDRVIETGHDPRRFVEDLLQRLRDLVVIAMAGDHAAAALRGVPADQLERMRTQAHHLGAAQLSRAADLVNDALTEMSGATSPRLQLELLCARLLLPGADEGDAGYGARLDRLERQIVDGGATLAPAGVPPAAAPPAAAPPAATPQRTPAAPPAAAPAAPAAAAPTAAAPVASAQSPTPVAGGPNGTSAPAPPRQAEPSPANGAQPTSQAPQPSSPATQPPAAPQQPPASSQQPPAAAPQQPPAAAPQQPPAAAAQSTATPAASRAPAPQPEAGADAEMIRRRWPEVIDMLARLKRSTWALVSQNAQAGEVSNGALHLLFRTPGLATAFRSGAHAEQVQRALAETLGVRLRVEGVVDEGGGGGGPARPSVSPAPTGTSPASADTPSAAVADARSSWASPATSPQRTPAAPAPGGRRDGETGAPTAHVPAGAGVAAGAQVAGPVAARSTPEVPPAPSVVAAHEADYPLPPEPVDEDPGEPGQAYRRSAPSPAETVEPLHRPPVALADDTPSRDDPDAEGSGMVGAPLVAQVLGGTVIEEITVSADGPGAP
ncbi:DNA polymerase III subunit gamma and tau [Georgenia sp. EYE_87]|uniref:DNA polymerase III subunit gamma and tau n=1 Tax=Georgenia sp. EYE_87 TaxID=2853448 RepID=UPI002005DF3A|nr:DNA polymerase III subunit gamma and tau [Georgenia sp. EYE_87]MCK6212501.1 DNA polymerase III subunit gamma and tau [Georgenia sp. EYE_87]MCK6212505.1 DNA polymerase III subunit gamma and tau [Georgenia sp. EYE_87]